MCNEPETAGKTRWSRILMLLSAVVSSLLWLCSCRTSAPSLPPVNLASPGWQVWQGQAIWRAEKNAPELAGDVLLARHNTDRAFVQFIKTPFPVLSGHITSDRWQIEFPPQNRSFAGSGAPPARLIWLRLPGMLFSQTPPPRHWRLEITPLNAAPPAASAVEPARAGATSAPFRWRLENERTGERLEGYLSP